MNKKNALLCAVFTICSLTVYASSENSASATAAAAAAAAAGDALSEPKASEQLKKLWSSMPNFGISNAASSLWNKVPNFRQEEPKPEPEPEKKNFLVEKWGNLSTTSKYALMGTVVCSLLAAIAYQSGMFDKKSTSFTASDVKDMVKTVLNDSSVTKEDKLGKIFELLVENGLTNIVTYNDHRFEVDNTFKVEICGNDVYVTRC